MEKTISFKGEENMYKVTFNMDGLAKNEDYISFTGEENGSSGQITVVPNPNSKWQKDLALFWKHLHLKHKDTIDNWTEEDKQDIAKKLEMEFGNFTWDGIISMIMSVMSHIEEEDKARRIQDYTDKKEDLDESDEKALALIQLLGEEPESMVDITQESYDDNVYCLNGESYLILTDSEADDRYDEYQDSILDDCMGIPDHIRPYFDDEKWKRENFERGELSGYDGQENQEVVNGNYYYLYKQ